LKKSQIYRHVTYEEMQDPLIRSAFLKAFNERTIDAGYLSRNKHIKTNCMTLRPKRGGPHRQFIDRYLLTSIPHPYIINRYLRCSIHKLAAFLFDKDELTPGKLALHECDIKMCCNPDHIYIGTSKENGNDYRNRRGDKKLNGNMTRYEWEVALYWMTIGEHSHSEIANALGCHKTTLSNPPNFTTDGSEVIGETFVPRIIPEAAKVTRIKKAIKNGQYFIKLTKMCKRRGWKITPLLEYEASRMKISISEVYRNTQLAQANPARVNYKYGMKNLIRMIKQGIDISVPL